MAASTTSSGERVVLVDAGPFVVAIVGAATTSGVAEEADRTAPTEVSSSTAGAAGATLVGAVVAVDAAAGADVAGVETGAGADATATGWTKSSVTHQVRSRCSAPMPMTVKRPSRMFARCGGLAMSARWAASIDPS
jgi:hypothetical protein